MNKLFYILTAIILVSCTSNSQNIARDKKYKISVAPNYALTNGLDDTDLTDGTKKTGLRFWQDVSTVGWRGVPEVELDIDLGEISSVTNVLINTARNSSAEVDFPLHCFVLTSIDNENFLYQGNLMESMDNISGSYQVNDFSLKTKSVNARYVKLVLIAKSKFMFLDEVEIHGSKAKSSNKEYKGSDLIRKNDLAQYLVNLKNNFYESLTDDYDIKSVQNFISVDNTNQQKKYSLSELMNLKKERQQNQLPAGIVVSSINDIDALRQTQLKDIVASLKTQTEDKKNNGNYFFTIVNNQSKTEEVVFNLPGSDSDLYEVVRASSVKTVNLYDVLKPISNNKIRIVAGEHKMFVLSYSRFDNNKDFVIASRKKTLKKIKFDISVPLKNTVLNDKLNANVWSYLDKPILKDNKRQVVDDLEKSGINTVVVHSGFIDDYKTKDFSKLKTYLKNFNNLQDKKVLLFYNLKNNASQKFASQIFLDGVWKDNFSSWYRLLLREVTKLGVKSENVFFYPYDEITKDEVKNFVELNKWAKKEIKDYQSFVTVIQQDTFEAANSADLVQISKFMLPYLANIKNKNIWLYDVLDGSRERNPFKDYRFLSWLAYYYDLNGIGFWNYSSLKDVENAKFTNVFDRTAEDYSVIYLDQDNNVLSSIRWMYFVKGLEDYQILRLAETTMGKEQVKKLVKGVIDKPTEDNANKVLGSIKFK